MSDLIDLYPGFDGPSYQLGIIDCFCEMVAAGVKGLALSHPLDPDDYRLLKAAIGAIAARYQVRYRAEAAFPETDLAPPDAVKGKTVVVFYKVPELIQAYEQLASDIRALEQRGAYGAEARTAATARLRALLGYPRDSSGE